MTSTVIDGPWKREDGQWLHPNLDPEHSGHYFVVACEGHNLNHRILHIAYYNSLHSRWCTANGGIMLDTVLAWGFLPDPLHPDIEGFLG